MALSKRQLQMAAIAVAILLVVGAATFGGSLRTHETWETRPIRLGALTLDVRIADTRRKRQQGLMHVLELGEREGLLMIYQDPRYMELWMKNTPVPLDAGFFDDRGILVDIASMIPDDGERRYPSPGPIKYVLEVNWGWFERHDIRRGARLSDSPPTGS